MSLFSSRLLLAGSIAALAVGCSPAASATRGSGFQAPACSSDPATGAPAATASRGADPTTADMTQPSEGQPHGALTAAGKPFSWALKPRVWRGNQPQPGWQGIAPTAMIYATQQQPESRGVRVEVRNISLFVRPRATGVWCLLDHRDAPLGALYGEDFAGDRSITVPLRPETAGGVSVHLVADHNFHFWGDIKPIPAGGLTGAFAQYEARIIADDDARPGDVKAAAYIGAASADYWKTPTSPAGHVTVFNEDAAIGRFKKLSGVWRLFTMNTNGGTPLAPPAP